MSGPKHRLTVSIDHGLIEAAHTAVRSGAAPSVSSWVGTAIEEKVRRDRRREHLAAFVADYESEFGDISDEELASQRQLDHSDAAALHDRSSQRRRGPAKSA